MLSYFQSKSFVHVCWLKKSFHFEIAEKNSINAYLIYTYYDVREFDFMYLDKIKKDL